MQFTGTKYEGDLHKNGSMEGKGKYFFSDGSYYKGEMKDGMFHGRGTVYFKGFGKYEAEWKDGVAIKGKYTFADGLSFQEEGWDYCTDKDRRFFSEIQHGLKPIGDAQFANSHPPPSIPKGTYDCGDGYFEPGSGNVVSYDGSKKVRTPIEDEAEWIMKSCRVGL